jgi:hypothetical protein
MKSSRLCVAWRISTNRRRFLESTRSGIERGPFRFKVICMRPRLGRFYLRWLFFTLLHESGPKPRRRKCRRSCGLRRSSFSERGLISNAHRRLTGFIRQQLFAPPHRERSLGSLLVRRWKRTPTTRLVSHVRNEAQGNPHHRSVRAETFAQ